MDENNNGTQLAEVKGREEKSGSYYEDKYSGYENKNYDTYDYMEEAKRINTREEPSTAAKVALVLIAVYFNVIGAIIGIIFGGIYMNKDGAGYKSYGKMLLIVSIVFLVIDIAIGIMFFAAVGNFLAMMYGF